MTIVLIGATLATLAIPIFITTLGPGQVSGYQLKKFSSYGELEYFVRTNVSNYVYYESFLDRNVWSIRLSASSKSYGRGDETGVDYSTTNIQVEGVDEADIVKSDGKYIYVVSGNKVVIIDAYPAEGARILSEIETNESPTELFINGDKLVILGWAFVKVYDVSNKENPLLTRDVSFDGQYFDSRMVGNHVYVIINSPALYDNKINLPHISFNGNTKTVPATEICYFENIHDYSYQFTTIMAINAQDDGEEVKSETFLIGATQNIFVSSNNIYVTYTDYWVYPLMERSNETSDWETENTIIHKISISDGTIEYKSKGEVPGHVLNQFSMDEYQGHFRIATTTGWMGQNNVYVLDGNLDIAGRLEGLAPGERIYSARFIGSRAYLVTFKKVDPLFVIDLEDPNNPKVLGELKIPGYSDYLHPYDETHLIGVGKDAVDMGSFAWYRGVKIALFDVSDPENPREISKYMIGDRGTDSYALQDHKAFLFSRSKNLLVIPVLLAEIDEERYPGGVPPDAYGEYVWQGAYVFNVSLDDGFVLKGRITHFDNGYVSAWDDYYFDRAWNGYHSYDYSVKRSLYIDNVLYTISGKLVKINDLEDLSEIGEIELGQER